MVREAAPAARRPILREASPADVPAIDRVSKAAFEEYRGRLDPASGAHTETREAIERSLQSGGAVLALVAGDAVGAVRYAREDDGSLSLSRLAVLPSHRRLGIARALVAAVEERGRALGMSRVTLGVRLALPGHRAYYERLGYKVERERSHPGYACVTWLEMAKPISG